jgi:hypothetical protein
MDFILTADQLGAALLSSGVGHWTSAQLFWIIKNGVKMTGMTSYGAVHKDEEIWNLVDDRPSSTRRWSRRPRTENSARDRLPDRDGAAQALGAFPLCGFGAGAMARLK